jgi:haloalkane dehalogenase
MSAQTPEVYRTADARFDNLPGYDFAPNYLDVDGLRMHYLDEGPRDGAPVVCFHGEPSWAYLYRKMIGPLVEGGHRVIVPDYAGFGRSDKPTDRRWYTYDRHSALMSDVLGALDVREATVVVQDWGGPIGLRWAVENPDRVAELAIFNTGLFTGRVSKGFLAWREFAERNPDLPVGFVIQGATVTDLPGDVVAAYEAPFPTAESKAGARSSHCWCLPARTRSGRSRCWRSAMSCRAGTSPHSSPSPTWTRFFPTRKPGRSFATSSRPRAPRSRSRVRPTSFKKTAGNA